MKKFLILLAFFSFGQSYAESIDLPSLSDIGPFTGLEATVGYIQKENGEKYLVVETPDGTKLIKVQTDPKKLIEKKTR